MVMNIRSYTEVTPDRFKAARHKCSPISKDSKPKNNMKQGKNQKSSSSEEDKKTIKMDAYFYS